MAYTTINKSSDYFNTKTYTGNAGTNAITGVGFKPDLTWIKVRDTTNHHNLCDIIRGVTKIIYANLNESEYTEATSLTAFGTDGFTLGGNGGVNGNNDEFVSWNWLAGGSQGSSNTDGSINTAYTSVNTTAGFSMSFYAGNDTAGATVGHGLGVVPKAIIIKRLSGSAQNWCVYHHILGNTDGMYLNTTDNTVGSNTFWNNTTPTNSVFTLGTSSLVNGGGGSDNFIAYSFAEKQGYSKFGSYIGNGNANGTFCYTGFKPAWVMQKSITTNYGWQIYDNKRTGFNGDNDELAAHNNAAETNGSGNNLIEFYSNGFKFKNNDINKNANNVKYIYMAFAEAPLVGSNNIPATAR